MSIKLDSQEQQMAMAKLITAGDRRIDFFRGAAQSLGNLDFAGGSRDALLENFQNFEKSTNRLAEQENEAVALIKKNVEISEQMMEAAYQRGKVEQKSFSGDIANKKGVTMSDL